MSENQQGMIKLCGLWKNKTKDGKVYYSGGLTYSTNLLLFSNAYKENPDDKKPDLILYIGKKEKKEDKQNPKSQDSEDPGSEDIPF